MSSNLPPGVTPSMIPGNRPEDRAWEYAHEQIDAWCEQQRLSPDDLVSLWDYVTAHVAPLWFARRRLRLAVDAAEASLHELLHDNLHDAADMPAILDATAGGLQRAQFNDEGVA